MPYYPDPNTDFVRYCQYLDQRSVESRRRSRLSKMIAARLQDGKTTDQIIHELVDHVPPHCHLAERIAEVAQQMVAHPDWWPSDAL